MATGSASASSSVGASQPAGRKPPGSHDATWKHGIMGPGAGTVICTWCMKNHSGGINRLKYHLAGIPCRDAKPCKKCPEEVKREIIALLAALDEKKLERARQQAAIQEAIAPNLSRSTITEVDVQHIVGSTRGPRMRGQSSSSIPSKFNFVPRNEPGSQPSLEATGWNREVHKEAKKACANFWYYNNIPFNVARSPYWESLVTALTIAGKGFKAPTPRDLSGRLLQDAIVDAKEIVAAEKKQWQKYGCSILSDGWTDGRNRTLINFIVVSNGVMVILKSIDASNIIKNAENLSLMLEEVVLEVGIENVVQVVTDNAAAYVAAGRLLQERHPTLFWTPCAAHCLDLLLEDIGKIDWVKPIVEEARDIKKYIYNHPWVLQLMREHTKGKELVRSGATRFATNFLTLQSITSLLSPLKQMFVSQSWVESTYSKKADGEKIVKIIFDVDFATRALEIVKVTEPLVRVLRLVDGEKNVMGYLYEAMDRAKEAIQHYYKGDANRFAPIWDIIDRRWNNQLHQPIHAAGYFLNPKFYFSESNSFTDANGEVMEGLFTCIERMAPTSARRDLILLELQNYKPARGQLFSSKMCIRGREIQTPSSWWEDFGGNTPNLQRLALQILSQPCSASGCERNWSLFDAIHTKKRNKLTQKCLNDLVFVQYNLRLRTRKVRDQPDELIDLDDIDPYSDWIVQDEASLFTEDEIADFERQAMGDLPAAKVGEFGLDEIDLVEEEPLPSTNMVELHAQSSTPRREPDLTAKTIPSTSRFFSRAGKRKM